MLPSDWNDCNGNNEETQQEEIFHDPTGLTLLVCINERFRLHPTGVGRTATPPKNCVGFAVHIDDGSVEEQGGCVFKNKKVLEEQSSMVLLQLMDQWTELPTSGNQRTYPLDDQRVDSLGRTCQWSSNGSASNCFG